MVDVEDDLGHREARAGRRSSAGSARAPRSRSSAVGLTATPGEEGGRRVDRLPVVVLAVVQLRDQVREPDRVDLVDAARAGVVADLGRVAGDREHVADSFGVGSEQDRLEAHDRRVARGEVRDRLDPDRALDRRGDDQRVHPHAGGRVVVDVHVARRVPSRGRRRRPRAGPRSWRRAADRSGSRSPIGPRAGRLARRVSCSSRSTRTASSRSTTAERRPRGEVLLDRPPVIAAISVGVVPQQPPISLAPRLARVSGELGEVVRRGVRVDDPPARHAGEADVRHRGERQRPAHRLEGR